MGFADAQPVRRLQLITGESYNCFRTPARSDRPLPAHRLFDQTDDHHQDAAAGSAGNDLPENRADIEATSPGCGSFRPTPEKRTNNLCADAAANDTSDRIADSSQIILLQCRAADIAADATSDQLDDQTDDSPPHVELLLVVLLLSRR